MKEVIITLDLNNTIQYINENAQTPQEFIARCEKRYRDIIDSIAKRIIDEEGREIVMLAGPSSAGKTTTAARLSESLIKQGVKTYVLSLDDFYFNREDIPFLPDGTQDFETVDALDLECFTATVNALLRGECVKAPVFDFETGRRSETLFNQITLGEEDVVIIEGLHALNPVITEKIEGKLLKIYINVSSRITDGAGRVILSKRNMRFIRRMVRDYKFRGSSVENTYILWKNVTDGEDKYLFPFRDNADIKANTIHLYEPCVLKHQALQMLKKSKLSEEFKAEARQLIEALEEFADIDEALVPQGSLLREFLGKVV